MRLVKTAVILLVVIVVLTLGVGLVLPRSVTVERSLGISAPRCAVFALVNSFERFHEWSPWSNIDPATAYVFEGPRMGNGAKMSWSSEHREMGTGSQVITESLPYEKVLISVEFGGHGNAECHYLLQPKGEEVILTWRFRMDFGFNLLGRLVGRFFESGIGPDLEKGLARLKLLAEDVPAQDWSALDVTLIQAEPVPVAYAGGRCAVDRGRIAAALAEAYARVGRFLAKNGIEQAGSPMAVTRSWQENEWVFDAAIPVTGVAELVVPEGSPVQLGTSYSGPAVRAVHIGPYGELGTTHEKIKAYMQAYGLEIDEGSWEQYISDPASTPEHELITHVFTPIK